MYGKKNCEIWVKMGNYKKASRKLAKFQTFLHRLYNTIGEWAEKRRTGGSKKSTKWIVDWIPKTRTNFNIYAAVTWICKERTEFLGNK